MPNVPIISAKEFCKRLEKYGCVLVGIRGSHHKIHNPKTGNTTPVSVHAGKDVSSWVFTSTLRQLGIEIEDFLADT